MYQAKSGVKNFSLYWGVGSPNKNFFPQSEHVSSQIWCQKFFPLLGGGGVPRQKFFSPVWTCTKPNLVSKIFPFNWGGGGPSTKIFFPSLNRYQAKSGVKNFPPYSGGGGRSLDKKFFFQSEHVSSQIWCQKIFPLLRLGSPPRPKTGYSPDLRPGTLPDLDLGPPPPGHWTWDPPTWTWTWDPPLPGPGPWTWDPPTPPTQTWDWVLSPPVEVWTDTQSENITFPILRMRAVKRTLPLMETVDYEKI